MSVDGKDFVNDTIICRCEEVTLGEIKEAIGEGTTSMNELRRHTRACMGLCQGRTCKRMVTQILAAETGRSVDEIEPPTARQPVRPVNLGVISSECDGKCENE